jgi:hypothetical protein
MTLLAASELQSDQSPLAKAIRKPGLDPLRPSNIGEMSRQLEYFKGYFPGSHIYPKKNLVNTGVQWGQPATP